MTAFLLTWDGSNEGYDPRDYVIDQARTRRGETALVRWSVGLRRSGTAAGDRVFLLRQHSGRGIVASGRLADGVINDGPHWNDPNKTAAYVDVEWDTVLDTADHLPLETLLTEVEGHNWNHVYSSGQVLRPATEQRLEQRWAQHLHDLGWPSPASASDHSAGIATMESATAPVLCIWSSTSTPTSVENLEVGLATQTWGLKNPPKPVDRLPRWVLFGHRHTNGGPRRTLDHWQAGELDIVLCEFTSPYYVATAPHWPDETTRALPPDSGHGVVD